MKISLTVVAVILLALFCIHAFAETREECIASARKFNREFKNSNFSLELVDGGTVYLFIRQVPNPKSSVEEKAAGSVTARTCMNALNSNHFLKADMGASNPKQICDYQGNCESFDNKKYSTKAISFEGLQ